MSTERGLPSIAEANKALRVLTDKRMKYTVTIHLKDKPAVEFQSEHRVGVSWNDSARALWITYQNYEGSPIMPWEGGTIILTEENPKP